MKEAMGIGSWPEYKRVSGVLGENGVVSEKERENSFPSDSPIPLFSHSLILRFSHSPNLQFSDSPILRFANFSICRREFLSLFKCV